MLVGCFLLGSAVINANAQDSGTLHVVPPDTSFTQDSLIRFEEIKQSPPLKGQHLPDTAINKLKKDEDFWYVNVNPSKPKKPSNFSSLPWLGKLLWVVVIASFIIIVIVFIANSNIRLFRRKAHTMNTHEGLQEEVNIFNLDFDKEIRDALDSRNFPLAIRFHYLQTLRLMSDKELIDYVEQKTNRSYVEQVRQTPYYKQFDQLTNKFEWVWYGKFPLNENLYAILEADYKQFKSSLAS